MDKREMFITCKCPKCGKELRIKPNTVSVFCLNCGTWSRVAPGKRDNDSKNVKK
ncbi:MAG: hypothetical protein HWN67_17795 [Candidatus Helarchaeota archaeon]|nr:hypothetical protein [Candidatus Helarchaeota archaeon]